jgi:hypothetical protein
MRNKIVKNTIGLTLTAIAAIVSTGSLAQAGDDAASGADQTAYAGIMIGGNISTASNGTITDSSMTPTIALTLGMKMPTNFGFGLFGSYFGRTSSGSFLGLPTGTNTGTTMLLGQGNYYLLGAHLGLEAGVAISSWSGTISSVTSGSSTTSLVYGPNVGYDLKIDKTISLGVEVHYLFSTAQNSVNNVQTLASFKIWL